MIEKGISRLGRPVNDVQVAIENVGNIEVAKLEKGLTVMATISGGAPMLGFLGTVTGMVRAFYEMANAGSGNIDITLHSLAKTVFIFLDGTFQSQIQCIAYQSMTDRDFVQPRYVFIKIIQIQ